MTDLGAVLRLPLWYRSVEHRAGPNRCTAEIGRVVVLQNYFDEIPTGPPFILILLEATREPRRLDPLLHRATGAGAQALILPRGNSLEMPTRLLAGRLATPMYQITEAVTPFELASEAVAFLAAPAAGAVDRIQKLIEEGLRSKCDADRTLELASELTGCRCWAWIPGRFSALTSGPEGFWEPPEAARVADGKVRSIPIDDATGLQLAVSMNGSVLTLGMAPQAGGRLGKIEGGVVLEYLALTIRAERTVDLLQAERDARIRKDLLNDLVSSGDHIPPPLEERLVHHGFPLSSWHLGIAISMQTVAEPFENARELIERLEDRGFRSILIPHLDSLIGWVALPQRLSATRAEELTEAIRDAVESVGSAELSAIGVGAQVHGMANLRRTLDEAREALNHAATRPTGNRIVTIDSLGIVTAIQSWVSAPWFLSRANTRLKAISESPELLQTLATYLDYALNVSAVSRKLGVHRNTVMMRIERIERLLRADLQDPDERLSLQLALRAFET